MPFFFAFICHEFGHVFVAFIFGFGLPGWQAGGLVLPPACQGKKETAVAFAGPAVNLLCFFLLPSAGFWQSAQILLALANLLPVLPLDGGRMIRGFLTGLVNWRFLSKVLSVAGIVFGIGIIIFTVFFGLRKGTFFAGWFLWGIILMCLAYKEKQNISWSYWRILLAQGKGYGRCKILLIAAELTVAEALPLLSPGRRYVLFLSSGGLLKGEDLLKAFWRGEGQLFLKEIYFKNRQ